MNFNKRIFFGLALLGLFAAIIAAPKAKADPLTPLSQVQVCRAASEFAAVARQHSIDETFPSIVDNVSAGHAHVEEAINDEYVPIAKRAITFGAFHKGTAKEAAAEFFTLCVQPKA